MCGHILQFVHALFANNVSSLRGKGIEGSNAGHGVLRRTSSERTFLPSAPWCHHLAARFLSQISCHRLFCVVCYLTGHPCGELIPYSRLDKQPTMPGTVKVTVVEAVKATKVPTKPPTTRAKRVHADVNKQFVDELLRFTKQNRSRSVSRVEKLDILLLQAHLRAEQKKKRAKTGAKDPPKARDVSKEVARILRRKTELVAKVWSTWVSQREVHDAVETGNRFGKKGAIVNTPKVTRALEAFLDERRLKKTSTVAKDVLDFLVDKGFMAGPDRGNRKAVATATRTVQRFLERAGFAKGTTDKVRHFYRKGKNPVERDLYIKSIMQVLDSKTKRVVFVSEHSMHKDHSQEDKHGSSPTGTVSDQDRCHFMAALIDADRTVADADRTTQQSAGVIPETWDCFYNPASMPKILPTMYKHDYFVKWMANLLKCIEARGVTNALIVMDRSPHHLKRPASTPTKTQSKAELQEACTKYGLTFDALDTKNLLWDKLRRYIKDNVQPVVVDMARAQGHDVVFAPKFYANLQPMAAVWTHVKEVVAEQYTSETTVEDVLDRLRAATTGLSATSALAFVDEAYESVKSLHNFLETHDDVGEQAAGDDDDFDSWSSDEDDDDDQA